jgi:hypothetical protein
MLVAMTNQNRDSADNWPTQQFRAAGGQPPFQPGGPAGPDGMGGPGGSGPRRPGRATRWGIGLAAAAVLIGGGAAIMVAADGSAQLSLAGHSGAADPAGSAGQASTGATSTGGTSADNAAGTPAAASGSQAAVLSTVLSSADSPNSAELAAASPTATQAATSGGTARAHPCAAIRRFVRAHPRRAVRRAARHPIVARRVRAVCRHRLARTRLLLHGIHGQFTFQTKKGTKTLAFERGTVESVASGTVTVRAADGTTWTWHLVSNTVIREGGKKTTAASLADGQRVFAGGPVVSGADNARLIVIRPAAAPAPSSSPAS